MKIFQDLSLLEKMIFLIHILTFANQLPYHLDENNNLFVHGGFNRHERLEEQGDLLWWDRDLWSQALSYGNMKAVDGALDIPNLKSVEITMKFL
jgi:hypothetical protein